MSVLVDTPIWSAALRRRDPSPRLTIELKRLITSGEAFLIGAIRQEILSGIREPDRFDRLHENLAEFPDIRQRQSDYETAAALFNTCRSRGVQGSQTDFLICATAMRLDLAIFTTDADFNLYARHATLRLHALP